MLSHLLRENVNTTTGRFSIFCSFRTRESQIFCSYKTVLGEGIIWRNVLVGSEWEESTTDNESRPSAYFIGDPIRPQWEYLIFKKEACMGRCVWGGVYGEGCMGRGVWGGVYGEGCMGRGVWGGVYGEGCMGRVTETEYMYTCCIEYLFWVSSSVGTFSSKGCSKL